MSDGRTREDIEWSLMAAIEACVFENPEPDAEEIRQITDCIRLDECAIDKVTFQKLIRDILGDGEAKIQLGAVRLLQFMAEKRVETAILERAEADSDLVSIK